MLADRYGLVRRPRNRRRPIVIGAIGVVALTAVVAFFTFWSGAFGATTLDVETLGYTVHDDRSVTVRWQVAGEASERLQCTIAAQDNSSAVVGITAIIVPAGAAVRSGSATVRTALQASSGLITTCARA